MLSIHDFTGTPGAQTFDPHLPSHSEWTRSKICGFSQSTFTDSVRLLRWVFRASPVTVSRSRWAKLVCQGAHPGAARGGGSTLAYAPWAAATAPGQIRLRDFKHLYRAHEVNRRTRVFGVVGDPVGHSLVAADAQHRGFAARRGYGVLFSFSGSGTLADFLSAVRRSLVFAASALPCPTNQEILRYLKGLRSSRRRHRRRQTRWWSAVTARLSGFTAIMLGCFVRSKKKLNLPDSRVLVFGAGGSGRAARCLVPRGSLGRCFARAAKVPHGIGRAVDGRRLFPAALCAPSVSTRC